MVSTIICYNLYFFNCLIANESHKQARYVRLFTLTLHKLSRYNVDSKYRAKVINLIFVSWDVLRAACGAASAGKYRSVVVPLNIDRERQTADSRLTRSVLAALSGNLRARRPQPQLLVRTLQ